MKAKKHKVGNVLGAVGKFLKNPAGVPQDKAGNYKYTRTNRSGAAGTNPKYSPLKNKKVAKKHKKVAKKHKMMCKKVHTHHKMCK